MMYCTRCQKLFEGRECPENRRHAIREPEKDDPCFLTVQDTVWGEMLADVLGQHDIPYMVKKSLGSGLAMSIGALLEKYRFFVPYGALEQAQELVDELFGGNGTEESEEE